MLSFSPFYHKIYPFDTKYCNRTVSMYLLRAITVSTYLPPYGMPDPWFDRVVPFVLRAMTPLCPEKKTVVSSGDNSAAVLYPVLVAVVLKREGVWTNIDMI